MTIGSDREVAEALDRNEALAEANDRLAEALRDIRDCQRGSSTADTRRIAGVALAYEERVVRHR